MYDSAKIEIAWADKTGIYHLPKNEFRKLVFNRLYASQQGKKIVFLDLKFWINFRDAKPEYIDIYTRLKELVEQQQITCVLSSSLLNEMEKIPFEKRLETARIMDRLQCKAVLNNINICTTELINLDRSLLGYGPSQEFQFSSIFESNPFLSSAVLSKHQLDHDFLYNLIYEDLCDMSVEQYCEETNSRHFDSSANFAQGFNRLKKTINRTLSYSEELVDGLESQLAVFTELTGYYFISSVPVKSSLAYFIQYAPHVYIMAAINAAIAVDKDRVFKDNDFFDSQHSCAAIGYTDFFFTERKFHHILASRPIEAMTHFQVKLGSDTNEILSLLNGI